VRSCKEFGFIFGFRFEDSHNAILG